MNRRTFLNFAAAWAGVGTVLPALGQSVKKPIVALVLTNVPLNQMTGVDPPFPPARAFVHQLRELGWIDGQTILFKPRSLEGDPERAPAMLAELVGNGPMSLHLAGRAGYTMQH